MIADLKKKATEVAALVKEQQIGLYFQDQIYGQINEFFLMGYDYLFNTRYLTNKELKEDEDFDL